MTAAQIVRKMAAAREKLDAVMAEAAEFARQQIADGVPEAVVARELRVNRLTVRRWLGKS